MKWQDDLNVPTAEVIYSVAGYLEAAGSLGARERVVVDVCGQSTTWVFEPEVYTGKKNHVVVPGEKIDAQRCAAASARTRGRASSCAREHGAGGGSGGMWGA